MLVILMSKRVKGRVQAVSLKPKKDYYGICIDDTWYNGNGDLKENIKEAEVKLEVKENSEDFIDIKNYDILEEDSQDAQRRDNSNAGSGGESNSSPKTSSTTTSMSERQASIQANSMTKTAAEIIAEHGDVDDGEFIEEVSTLAHGLNEISSDIREENLE